MTNESSVAASEPDELEKIIQQAKEIQQAKNRAKTPAGVEKEPVAVEPVVAEPAEEPVVAEEPPVKRPAATATSVRPDEVAPAAPKYRTVKIDQSSIRSDNDMAEILQHIDRAVGQTPVFQVIALHSGYVADVKALSFRHISALRSSSVDAYASRTKLLRTLHEHLTMSCGRMSYKDWLGKTANGDYDTLMYGLYAATYPGPNTFDVNCQHCRKLNKVEAEVGELVRVEDKRVYGQVLDILDRRRRADGSAYSGPMVDGAHAGMVTAQVALPESGIVAEIRDPTIQDYMDSIQWFVQNQDQETGQLGADKAGMETLRTLSMYVPRFLVPDGRGNYMPVEDSSARMGLIGDLGKTDGPALVDAVDEEVKRLDVSYQLPNFNCSSCGKLNEKLFLDFEALLFIRLREKG